MEELINWIQSKSVNQLLSISAIDDRSQQSRMIPVATAAGATTFMIYLGIVRYFRYRNLNGIIKKYPNSDDILKDLEAAQEVFAITIKREFPFLAEQGAELALFKTFTIPTISKILAATGEFKTNCPRRAEDTLVIVSEIVDTYGRIQKQLIIDPNTPKRDIMEQWERPKEALDRLNHIHSHYNILNDDYIYTLSLFIFEPISWINRYDWRQLDQREINAIFRVWYDVGVAMNIKDIPDTFEKMSEFRETNHILFSDFPNFYCRWFSYPQARYATEKIKYSVTNWKCGEPTMRHLLSKLPWFMRDIGYQLGLRLLPSILDPRDLAGFQLPYPESSFITFIVKSILAIRAYFVRYAMLPRRNYLNRTPFYANKENRFVPEFFKYKPHIYENGYVISELGPEKFLKGGECPATQQ